MQHLLAVALTLLWTAGNLYLWSLKQEPLVLFWQSLGMGALAFPAFGWYVARPTE